MKFFIKNQSMNNKVHRIILLYLCIVPLLASLSFVLTRTLQPNFFAPIHISAEIICITICIIIFIIMWKTIDYYQINLVHYQLGFGLLVVAILDIFHIYYFYFHDTYLSHMSMWYWLVARLFEGFTLIFTFYKFFNKFIKHKKRNLFFMLSIAGFLIILFQFEDFFTRLKTSEGFTNIATMLLWTLVLVYALAFICVCKFNKEKANQVTKNEINIAFAVLMYITSGLSYTQLHLNEIFFGIFGDFLKLCAYYFLFKSVIKISITYPYKELIHSKDHLNHILDNLPMGIVGFNEDGRVCFANDNALRIFCCKFETIKNISKDEYYTMFNINKDINNPNLTSIRSLNGKRQFVKWHELDTPAGYLNILEDASIEQQLKNYSIQTDIILNSINNFVIIFNKDHEIIYVNDSCLKFTEMTREQMLGMSVEEFNDTLQIKYNGIPWRQVNVKVEETHEYTLTTPSGKEKIIMSEYKRIEGIYNEVIGYVSIAIDLTKIREEQERVEQQERLALIGQMGNGIVHETKNYLASIKGYCDLLSISLDDEKLISYVEKIKYVANDMNSLVEQYLNLSKPSEIILDIVSINELIDSIRYVLESPSFLSGAELTIDLCQNEMEILADDAMIQNVLINLAKNAVEAMKETENPKLKISTALVGNNMEIRIEDNGCGISPENLKKIGTPFFTTKKTGTGLGLSNCYKNVQDCGGQIRVESELGKGTTFIVSFPVFEDEYSEQNDPCISKNPVLQLN